MRTLRVPGIPAKVQGENPVRRQSSTVLSSSNCAPGSVPGRSVANDHQGVTLDGMLSPEGTQSFAAERASLSDFEVFTQSTREDGGPSIRDMLTGPRYFPHRFDSPPTYGRRRNAKKRRGNQSRVGPALDKSSRDRLRLWKKLLEVLICHRYVPEDKECLLIQLAEHEGVSKNESGLEGWTVVQLLDLVSARASDGFELLAHAVKDIVDSLSCNGSRVLRTRSSNITQWRPEVQRWLQAQNEDVVLIQETHLPKAAVPAAVSAVCKTGYEFFGGEAFKSSSKGTSGGVAVLARTHLQAQARQHFTVEGCGYCGVEFPVKGVSLLLLSLYLKASTPRHCHPNAEILASVIALIKDHRGQWLVAGDLISAHRTWSRQLWWRS